MVYDKIDTKPKCPRCAKSKIIVADDEACCSSCGYVIPEKSIATGPEWHSYNDTKDNARAGALPSN